MASLGDSFQLLTWKKRVAVQKVPARKDDADQWKKRVQMASEFALSEAFSHKKPNPRTSQISMRYLQGSEQLREEDDVYTEAQALLDEWLSDKLRKGLGLENEDNLRGSAEHAPQSLTDTTHPSVSTHNNFKDLYNSLAEEEEQCAVDSFLQDLMKQKLLNAAMIDKLSLDDRDTRKQLKNPITTMEARHQQVRENRLHRDTERLRQQKHREALMEARKEAKKREQEEEEKTKQEKRRQELLLQREVAKQRRQKEKRRVMEQLARQREKQKELSEANGSPQSTPTLPSKQHLHETQRLQREQKIMAKIQMKNLQCLHRHLSEWYSLTLDRKLRAANAAALRDWRRQLKAWRVWRAVVWERQKQREVAKMEEDLRQENRQYQMAVESYRRRLLLRCLNEWHLWCLAARAKRELLARREETKRRMSALLSAAAAGKLLTAKNAAIPEPSNAPETTAEEDQHMLYAAALHPPEGPQDKSSTCLPLEAWQVSRRHTVPTAVQLQEARKRAVSSFPTDVRKRVQLGGRFENRHAVQQHIIKQQRQLLKEQQDQIARLKQEQNKMGSELEPEKALQPTQQSALQSSTTKSQSCALREEREPRVTGEATSQSKASSGIIIKLTRPDPIVTAMEARARERAERRKEVEELKRRKKEEKMAEKKAAEEQKRREEEQEKRKAAEKKREEKRLQQEREEERQREVIRLQELTRMARQHYNRALLFYRGLAPWKKLIQRMHANTQLAEHTHNLFLLRRCTQTWQQRARESATEKESAADRLHQHFLIRRSLNCWKRFREMRMNQAERAECFYQQRTLRRCLLALLDHVTQQRLVEWDRRKLAEEHRNRRALQTCFLAWRQLPSALRKEQEREARREKLMRRVMQILPDFRSNVGL